MLKHVNVVDVEKGRVIRGQTVVINEGRIAALGPDRRMLAPQSGRIIDGRGKFLIPGLWDMHVHALSVERLDSMFPNVCGQRRSRHS